MTKSKLKYLGLALALIFVLSFGYALGKFGEKSVLSDVSPQETKITDKNSDSADFVNGNDEESFNESLVMVTKVIDGDTIAVSLNGKQETLRLIGIDSPETVDPRKPVQCYGQEASNKAKSILLGKDIFLEADETQGERDKYKRLLRYVIFPNGENFNLQMIKEGFAHEYTYDLPYKYQAEFKAAQKFARENNLGLWNPSACDSSLNKTIIPSPSGQNLGQTEQKSAAPSGTYTCDCGKLCGAMSTCDEAYYQLNTCGCFARDSDRDGVPCETLCR